MTSIRKTWREASEAGGACSGANSSAIYFAVQAKWRPCPNCPLHLPLFIDHEVQAEQLKAVPQPPRVELASHLPEQTAHTLAHLGLH